MNIWLLQIGEPLPIKNGVRKMRAATLADKLLERGHSERQREPSQKIVYVKVKGLKPAKSRLLKPKVAMA